MTERRVDPHVLARRDAAEAAAPVKAFGVLPARRRFPLRRAKFPVIAEVLAGLARRLGRPARVLDAGLGQAKLERVHAHAHPDAPVAWFGLDRHRYRLDLRRELPGIVRVQGDVTALPYRAASFDAAVCSYVLQHLARPEAALAELARVVAPGGLVVVAVPNSPQPLKLLLELLHPALVWFKRRVRGRRFDYGAQVQFWNLPRLRRAVEAAGLRPARWQGLGLVSGGPLGCLEDRAWWYRLHLRLGAAAPRLGQDLVVVAEAGPPAPTALEG
ncbi:MAG: methyltransferase domain-containing protein [Planctomycetota bacterium]|nr:methyltransferase domain-containing protein [Planctomycetota bacterium]